MKHLLPRSVPVAWRVRPIAAVLVIAIALFVLLGWTFGFEQLTGIVPGTIIMIPNTAVALLLAGISLLLLRSEPGRKARAVAYTLAVLTLVFGFATLSERVFNINLGFDLLLFRDRVIEYPWLPPGRTATNSAICFCLAGIGLLLLDRRWRHRWPSQGLAWVGLAIAAAALIGYLYGVRPLYAIDRAAGMALLTAVSLATLYLGILFARPDRGTVALFTSRDMGGMLLRRLLPAGAIMPTIFGGIWLRLRNADLISREGGITMFVVLVTSLMITLILMSALTLRTVDRERDLLLSSEANARAQAEAANRAKTEFLATVSHELRTPLNAIIGYVSLLIEGVPEAVTPGQRKQLDRISRSAQHLLSLIEEVLDVSQLEAGERTMTIGPVVVGTLIDDVSTMISPLAYARHLHFERKLAPDAQGVVLQTDATKLRQSLINLLANAVKFTERGSVTLDVFQADHSVVFRVIDTGRGIAPEHLDRIFDPFWQAEQTSTRTVGGAGLGLAVTRGFAELLQAELTVASQPGRGSTFTLRVPIEWEERNGHEGRRVMEKSA